MPRHYTEVSSEDTVSVLIQRTVTSAVERDGKILTFHLEFHFLHELHYLVTLLIAINMHDSTRYLVPNLRCASEAFSKVVLKCLWS